MGLFDDFDIDMDEVEAPTGFNIADGHYDFEISEARIQAGSNNNPNDTFFVIEYDMDEDGKKQEWFTAAVDGDANHARAKQSLGFLKNRLLDLGFQAAQLNDLDPEDLEGIVGTLEIATTSGKGKNAGTKYQNVRNVKVSQGAAEADDEPEYDETAAKKRVAANQAARAKAEAPKKTATVKKAAPKRPAATTDDDEDENPFDGE